MLGALALFMIYAVNNPEMAGAISIVSASIALFRRMAK